MICGRWAGAALAAPTALPAVGCSLHHNPQQHIRQTRHTFAPPPSAEGSAAPSGRAPKAAAAPKVKRPRGWNTWAPSEKWQDDPIIDAGAGVGTGCLTAATAARAVHLSGVPVHG